MPGVLIAVVLAASDAAAPPSSPSPVAGSPFRYDDDPQAEAAAASDLIRGLKLIPLGDDRILSFGADLRERIETSDTTLLGLRGAEAQTYGLHRILVHGDLRLGEDTRIFVQLGDHDETGRKPGPIPTDVDRLDLQQGFIDLSHDLGVGRAALRLGRAEMSYDDGALVGLRDGPNVRQVWDGARASLVSGAWRWDAFSVHPVAVKPGALDDGRVSGQSLSGVHLTTSGSFRSPWAVDAFVYQSIDPAVRLAVATGKEDTTTLGLRGRGAAAGFDGSVGAMWQSGSLAGRPVQAYALHADLGWSAPGPWSPHVGLRGDLLSGGDDRAHTVRTFNALYPNVSYSTEAAIEAPANLLEIGTVARLSPTPAVSLQYTLEGLWRASVRDAFYGAPLAPLVRPDGSRDRFSGVEQQVKLTWRVQRTVTVTTALVRFDAGDFIRNGGGRDETFAMTSVSVRL